MQPLKLTTRQAAIISAYTGVALCRFDHIQEYASEKFGFAVMQDGLPKLAEQLRRESRDDFLALMPGYDAANGIFFEDNSGCNDLTPASPTQYEEAVRGHVDVAADNMWADVPDDAQDDMREAAVEMALPAIVHMMGDIGGVYDVPVLMERIAALHAVSAMCGLAIQGIGEQMQAAVDNPQTVQ